MERLPYFDTHAHLDTEDFDADREDAAPGDWIAHVGIHQSRL